MSAPILYSILIPVYGAEKYLSQCIDSLLGQTYPNIEILLVDDGARDRSPEICDRYAAQDPRVKVLHKENGGVGSARKAGAQMASGDYILCVDADDWVCPDYVREFDAVIRQHHPDLVCCGYIQTDGEKEWLYPFPAPSGYYSRDRMEQHIYPMALENRYGVIFSPQVWAKAIKRELYLSEQLAADDAIKIGEDGAVIKPIVTRAASLCVIDQNLYYYRINPESATHRSAYDWNGPLYIYRHLRKRVDLQAFDYEAQLYRCIARLLYTVVYSQFNRQESYRSIKKDIKARLMEPEYRQVLEKARYKSLKTRLEVFLMKHRLALPIYLLHRLSK